MSKTNKIYWLCIIGMFFSLFLTSVPLQASDINSDGKNLLGLTSNTKSLSLLDPSRVKINNSYSFSYFSGGNTSGSFGIYTTTLKYRVSNPLSIALSLNYLHQPLSVFGRDDLRIKNSIMPNFQLYYRPNNNFSFMINVLTFPPPYSWGNENMWIEDKR